MLDINEAKKFVKENNIKNISTSQIRKFLYAVNKINNKVMYKNDDETLSDDIIDEIAYMRVQFAYIFGKNVDKHKQRIKKLYEKFDPVINNIIEKRSTIDFINFARYVEAIIAYHKFYGGDNNGE